MVFIIFFMCRFKMNIYHYYSLGFDFNMIAFIFDQKSIIIIDAILMIKSDAILMIMLWLR